MSKNKASEKAKVEESDSGTSLFRIIDYCKVDNGDGTWSARVRGDGATSEPMEQITGMALITPSAGGIVMPSPPVMQPGTDGSYDLTIPLLSVPGENDTLQFHVFLGPGRGKDQLANPVKWKNVPDTCP
ncbi:MAG: hypothetical protein H8E37_04245 [Planctomycetes bacterium]|nr:hypothetical protein [Planctomycetota bacterium]